MAKITVMLALGLVASTLVGGTTPNPPTSVNSGTTEHWPVCNYTRDNLISGKSLISLVTFNDDGELLLYDDQFCGYKADTELLPFGQTFVFSQNCLYISQQGMYPPPTYLVRNTSVCKDSSSAFLFLVPKVPEKSVFGYEPLYRVVTVCTKGKKTYLQGSLILNATGLDANVPDPEGVQEVAHWLEDNEMVFSTGELHQEGDDPSKVLLFGMTNKDSKACLFKMTVEATGQNLSTFRVSSKVPTSFCIDAPSPLRRGFEQPKTIQDTWTEKDDLVFYAFNGANDAIKLKVNPTSGDGQKDSEVKADAFFVCENPPDILATDKESFDSSPVEEESSSGDGGLSLPAILAITLSSILSLLIVIFLFLYCCKTGETGSEEKGESENHVSSRAKSAKARVGKMKSVHVKSSIVMASKNSSSAKSPKGSSKVGKGKAPLSGIAKSKVSSEIGKASACKSSSKGKASSKVKSSSLAKSSGLAKSSSGKKK